MNGDSQWLAGVASNRAQERAFEELQSIHNRPSDLSVDTLRALRGEEVDQLLEDDLSRVDAIVDRDFLEEQLDSEFDASDPMLVGWATSLIAAAVRASLVGAREFRVLMEKKARAVIQEIRSSSARERLLGQLVKVGELNLDPA